jgi:hypothetical protein
VKISEVKSIFATARANNITKRLAKSAGGVGCLRGAMAGAAPDGGAMIAAKCPRLDQARFRGYEATTEEGAEAMFAAGFGHEVHILQKFAGAGLAVVDRSGFPAVDLEALKIEAATITEPLVLREQGVRSTVHGNPWQGTPDFMYIDAAGTIHGIEAKAQVTNFGVAKAIRAGWPQRKHVLQCSNYMAIMGLDEWLLCIGHNFIAQVDGDKIMPSVRWFRVFIDAATGNHAVENETGEVFVLDYTGAAVLSYQKLLLESEAAGKLAPRPKWKELFPNMKGYDECNYCSADMSNECNRADVGKLDYAGWLERLKHKTK